MIELSLLLIECTIKPPGRYIWMTRRLVYQVQYINWAGRIRLERADRRQYINWGNHSTCFDRLRILLPTSLLNRALNYELTAKFLLNKAIQMAWWVDKQAVTNRNPLIFIPHSLIWNKGLLPHKWITNHCPLVSCSCVATEGSNVQYINWISCEKEFTATPAVSPVLS